MKAFLRSLFQPVILPAPGSRWESTHPVFRTKIEVIAADESDVWYRIPAGTGPDAYPPSPPASQPTHGFFKKYRAVT